MNGRDIKTEHVRWSVDGPVGTITLDRPALGGEEAERWGFFNRLCEPDAALSLATGTAESLARGPSFAHALTKRMMHLECDKGIEKAIDTEAQAQAIAMQTQDFRRAYEAFIEKRKPVFAGN